MVKCNFHNGNSYVLISALNPGQLARRIAPFDGEVVMRTQWPTPSLTIYGVHLGDGTFITNPDMEVVPYSEDLEIDLP